MADIENKRKSRRLTKTEQWERAHPDDVPCPRGQPDDYEAHRAARIWRMERGIIVNDAVRLRRERDRAEALNKTMAQITETLAALPADSDRLAFLNSLAVSVVEKRNEALKRSKALERGEDFPAFMRQA